MSSNLSTGVKKTKKGKKHARGLGMITLNGLFQIYIYIAASIGTLARELHPDQGGDKNTFQEMQNQYDKKWKEYEPGGAK